MGALINDAELLLIRSEFALAEVPSLTGQQEQFLLHYVSGLSIAAAERAAGYSEGRGRHLLMREDMQAALDYLRERRFKEVKVTREMLTQMLFEAHSHAGDATEEIKAIVELGKMHGLYESDRQARVQVNIQNNNVTNVKQLERMDDSQLLEITGDLVSLEPTRARRTD